ncbi:MAG: (2E,6E)-farnesyl diphosphate synthase [Gammaproteobacteria bacterium]|nr:(2E,6E)-farnesyl diphosphate synthase [Gammaproteobacteria bacterium]
MEFESRLERYRLRVDKAMQHYLPTISPAGTRLKEAMHYAVTNGGKRVRPVLTYATGEALGADLDKLDAPACAVEMMHAYSLVHDDLPAMDDDDLRRGKPTCHKKYDEATAILAGDALQALAFTLLTKHAHNCEPACRLEMIRVLGEASGAEGMAEGQAIDLESVGHQLTLAELENMHRHKTGALIRASVLMGALAAGASSQELLKTLDSYAAAIGLSFQIIDDILDIVGDTAVLGKPQGSDIALNKPTYPALLGLDGARNHARNMHELAMSHLQDLPASFDILRDLSHYILDRTH